MRRQKRQQIKVFAAATLALGVAWAVALLRPGSPPLVTRENCDRIRLGMSRAEVEAILGPWGDYTTGPTAIVGNPSFPELRGTSFEIWCGDTVVIHVGFDGAQGRVESKAVLDVKRQDQGVLDNLFWRIDRRWPRLFR